MEVGNWIAHQDALKELTFFVEKVENDVDVFIILQGEELRTAREL